MADTKCVFCRSDLSEPIGPLFLCASCARATAADATGEGLARLWLRRGRKRVYIGPRDTTVTAIAAVARHNARISEIAHSARGHDHPARQ